MNHRMGAAPLAPLLAVLALGGCGGGNGGGGGEPLLTISATATGNGSISPEEVRVRRGNAAQFTLLPDEGHVPQSVTGCGGALDGTTYTIAKVTEDCTVSATFAPQRHTVTATAAANGSITPGSVEVTHGSSTSFTLTPAANFLVGEVSGCGGELADNVYTTQPITAACAITATFLPSYALGGTVSGLSSGASLLLGTTADQALVSANGAFAFPARLAAGSAYSVQLLAQPAGHECTLANAAGVIGTADVGNVTVSCVTVVAPLYPSSGTNWNDYVANDGADPFHAGDTPCNSLATGGPSACVHGGERRVYALPSHTSCAGLTATDALGAFDWTCDTSMGHARFVSRLKGNTRVADLIDFSGPHWRDNRVTVLDGATEVAASVSRKWWNNPLVIDNDGLTAAEASAAGTLYLVSQDTTAAYALGASKTGLVIREGMTLTGSGSAAVTVSGKDFLWIEGSINATGAAYGISASAMRFSVLRNMRVANASSRGIYLVNSVNNRLSRLLLDNNQIGLNIYSSPDNAFTGLTAVSSGYGIIQEASHDNVLAGLTLANNSNYGLSHASSGHNVLAGLAVTGNASAGLNVYAASANTFADLAMAHNYQGINLGSSTGNRFTGRLLAGGNTSNCVVTAGTLPGLVTATCANAGASDATLSTDVSLALAFAGKVSADDAANSSDNNGAAAYPATPASFDWTRLGNAFRAWGRDGGLFPSTDNRGRWSSGAGRIWDWSVAATDTTLRNALALPGGNDVITHTWSGGGSTTFLRHAVEIDGDSDGLCESNETCLYTPNLGAYQGHGALVSAGTFSSGAVSGVRLLKYAHNGR